MFQKLDNELSVIIGCCTATFSTVYTTAREDLRSIPGSKVVTLQIKSEIYTDTSQYTSKSSKKVIYFRYLIQEENDIYEPSLVINLIVPDLITDSVAFTLDLMHLKYLFYFSELFFKIICNIYFYQKSKFCCKIFSRLWFFLCKF